jgi:hypothetical protein
LKGGLELEYIFFCRTKREIFFQNLTLGYMTKTLNQIFFFLHQNQNIFFSNIGNQNIFLEKNHNPPFKLNGRSLMWTDLLHHFKCSQPTCLQVGTHEKFRYYQVAILNMEIRKLPHIFSSYIDHYISSYRDGQVTIQLTYL